MKKSASLPTNPILATKEGDTKFSQDFDYRLVLESNDDDRSVGCAVRLRKCGDHLPVIVDRLFCMFAAVHFAWGIVSMLMAKERPDQLVGGCEINGFALSVSVTGYDGFLAGLTLYALWNGLLPPHYVSSESDMIRNDRTVYRWHFRTYHLQTGWWIVNWLWASVSWSQTNCTTIFTQSFVIASLAFLALLIVTQIIACLVLSQSAP